jgi:hypothetical protein
MKLNGTSLVAKSLATFILCVFCSLAQNNVNAQDLRVFGYSQSLYQNQVTKEQDGAIEQKSRAFYAQQTNLFFASRFNRKSSGFVNIEFVNNQDVANDFGNFSLQEAWFDYKFNRETAVKFGKLLPKFGSFNEQRNRTPIFNFASRPLIYENLYGDIFNQENFVPLYAFFQAEKKFGLGDKLSLESSVFMGNSEQQLMLNRAGLPNASQANVSGQDTTSTITVGGKLNFVYSDYNLGIIKLGFSAAYDEGFNGAATSVPDAIRGAVGQLEAAQLLPAGSSTLLATPVGSAPRMRYVVDLLVQLNRFELMGEYAWAEFNYSDQQEQLINQINAVTQNIPSQVVGFQLPGFFRTDPSTFWYMNATYTFDSGFYATGRYEQYSGGRDALYNNEESLNVYTIGAGYRYNNLVFKTEYTQALLPNAGIAPSTVDDLFDVRVMRVAAGFTF